MTSSTYHSSPDCVPLLHSQLRGAIGFPRAVNLNSAKTSEKRAARQTSPARSDGVCAPVFLPLVPRSLSPVFRFLYPRFPLFISCFSLARSEEYSGWKTKVLCYDCEHYSEVPYHFYYLKVRQRSPLNTTWPPLCFLLAFFFFCEVGRFVLVGRAFGVGTSQAVVVYLVWCMCVCVWFMGRPSARSWSSLSLAGKEKTLQASSCAIYLRSVFQPRSPDVRYLTCKPALPPPHRIYQQCGDCGSYNTRKEGKMLREGATGAAAAPSHPPPRAPAPPSGGPAGEDGHSAPPGP